MQTVDELWSTISKNSEPDAAQWAALDALDEPAVRKWIKDHPQNEENRLWRAMVLRLAAFDGPAAWGMVRKVPTEKLLVEYDWISPMAQEVCAVWAQNKPDEFLQAHPDATVQNIGWPALQSLLGSRLEQAMEMIGRSAETKSEDDWLFYGHAPDLNLNDLLLTPSGKQALEQLHASHPKHALAILRNLLEMDGLPLTPGSVFPYLPSEIARDFPKSVTDKDALRQMAYFSDSNIMEVIPEDGMDILEECSFTNEVMLTWATGDPESAGLWLNAMPPSPGLDRAVYGYIAAISDLYPADATSWLSKISDSATRLEASRILFSKWQRLSSTAAQAWIQESSLSAIERRFVCNPWGDRRGEN